MSEPKLRKRSAAVAFIDVVPEDQEPDSDDEWVPTAAESPRTPRLSAAARRTPAAPRRNRPPPKRPLFLATPKERAAALADYGNYATEESASSSDASDGASDDKS